MDKKSILIGALGASLLFVTIGAGTQQEQVINTTVPESHEWEFYMNEHSGSKSALAFSLNKRTGEVRKFVSTHAGTTPAPIFKICTEKKEK